MQLCHDQTILVTSSGSRISEVSCLVVYDVLVARVLYVDCCKSTGCFVVPFI